MTMLGEALFEEFGRRATVHLDTDAIATLHTAPTLIVPAAGEGTLLVVTGGMARYVPGTGQWLPGDPQSDSRIYYGPNSPDGEEGHSATCIFTPIWNQIEVDAGPQFMSLVSAGDDGTEPSAVADGENRPLIVGDLGDPGTDGPTTGDLYVTIFYMTVEL